MICNTAARDFEVIEITNEMPLNRIGGVGSVIEALHSGFDALGVRALWYVADHQYLPHEVEAILDRHPCVALGGHAGLAAFRAPVAHVHSYSHAPGLLDALGGSRSLFTVHSLLACEERFNDVDLRGAVADQERLIAACDEVALVSEAERRHYLGLGYARLNRRVGVVHNGIAPPPRAARRRRGGRGAVLGYCGRLVPRKHPEYVQMLLLEPGFEDCEALIAGKAFSRYARDLVARLGIEDRVGYLGWCGGARLDAFFDAIDVLVQPSTYEPFGLAVLEAAARGVPVVCGEVDGLVEVLGEHAFYCDPTSYASFVDAMRRWRQAGDERIGAVAAGARARALERYTDVAMARRYVARFAALAAPGAAGESRGSGAAPRLRGATMTTHRTEFVLPAGYEELRGDCERFFVDHPHYDRNVFVMMRFDEGDRPLAAVDEELRRTLCRHGLEGLRADDRMYPADSQLWKNVCVYMLCCRYGVAVLEDRARDEFNPNVALEYGFMRALDKRTLLLADRGFSNLRADIVGTVREQFDIADLAGTLAKTVERWIAGLGVDAVAGPSALQEQALKAHRRLLRIRCSALVRDEARRAKERNDEFWYFGEEIEAYRALLRREPDAAHEAAVEDAARRVAARHDFAAVTELAERFAALAR